MEVSAGRSAEKLDEVVLKQALYRFCAAGLLYPEEKRRDTLKQAAQWLIDNVRVEWLNEETRLRLARIFDWAASLGDDLTEMQVNWVRLFGVSRSAFCYPYEGATVPAEFTGSVLAHLQKEYAEAGLELSTDDLPDHISVQLEYLSFLCGIEAEALQKGEDAKRKVILKRRRRFLEQHSSRWFSGLAERVEHNDGQIFADICAAAAGIIESERAHIDKQLTL